MDKETIKEQLYLVKIRRKIARPPRPPKKKSKIFYWMNDIILLKESGLSFRDIACWLQLNKNIKVSYRSIHHHYKKTLESGIDITALKNKYSTNENKNEHKDSIKQKRKSKLETHREVIIQLNDARASTREIALWLHAYEGIKVHPTTVQRFLHRQQECAASALQSC